MTEKRVALIIASYQYEDADLQQLVAPAQDAEALARVLADPAIGGFEVQMLLSEPSYKVNRSIEAFFADRKRDDLLLLYFSGHGIKDEEGRLYFATIDTQRKLLRATAIPATLVNDVMRYSRSQRQVLLLDCCYSGAFARGMVAKADKDIDTGECFAGRGRVVLTASAAMQYAFEGDRAVGKGVRSVFTHHLVRGLETGEADLNRDGVISLDELYEYAYDRVTDETPQQRPGKWAFDVQGEIIIARNPRPIERREEGPERKRQINPFIYGGPVPPLHFIGRDKEVDTIMSRLVSPGSGSSAVSGEAQIGKTSLLRYIASPQVLKRWGLEPNRAIFAEVDCQILSSFAPLLFWRTVLYHIKQKVEGTDLESEIEAARCEKDIAGPELITLFKDITKSRELIVLLLDEFELVVKNIDPNQPDFLNTLRALIQLPRLALVTATRTPLETLTRQIPFVHTRFPRAFAPIELGPFSREEANELIYRALQDKGIFDEDDRQFVYEVSKGHPYWLQNTCFKLFQRKTSHGAV